MPDLPIDDGLTQAPAPANRRRVVLQVVASIGILLLLLQDVDFKRLLRVLQEGSVVMLFVAFGVKALGLLLHEFRLWMALPEPRPRVRPVISLGLAAGVLNLALPARAGDFAAIAFLRKECRIPIAVGTMAVGVTSALEAIVFGTYLLFVLTTSAPLWASLIGETARQEIVHWLGLGVTVTITGGAILALIGTRIGRFADQASRVNAFFRSTIGETARALRDSRFLSSQTIAAIVQVGLVVAAFSIALLAAGVQLSRPDLAASMVLATASIAAVLLPPTFAAGPAAASAAILPLFGVSHEGAIAYAGAYWLVAHVPAITMGLPCLWARRLTGGSTPKTSRH